VRHFYKENRGFWAAVLDIAMSYPTEAKPVQVSRISPTILQ